jgi:hypothetical protein
MLFKNVVVSFTYALNTKNAKLVVVLGFVKKLVL